MKKVELNGKWEVECRKGAEGHTEGVILARVPGDVYGDLKCDYGKTCDVKTVKI